MARRFAVRVAFLSVMAAGCSTVSTRGFSCPSGGESGWSRYSTPHVVLDASLPEPVARQAATLLEASHAALRQATFTRAAEASIHVVAVPVDLLVAGPGGAASAWPNLTSAGVVGVDDAGAVVELGMRGAVGPRAPATGLTTDEAATIWRTVARLLTVQTMPSRPLWLEDGLAVYHEAARFDGKELIVGIAPRGVLQVWRSQEPPMSGLLSAKRCEQAALRDQVLGPASAFILVDYLATERSDAFARYTRGLADGQPEAEAWVAAFPDLAPGQDAGLAALDRNAAVHGNQQRFRSFAFPARVETFEVKRRPMTCEEVRGARIEMFARTKDAERAEREVAALLAEMPTSEVGALAKARLARGPSRVSLARAVTERHPGSAVGWALLADALPAGDERRRAAERAAELGAGVPEVELSVAAARLDEGNAGEAVAIARRVLERVPWSIAAATTLARGLAGTGRCGDALAVSRRAEDLAAARCEGRAPRLDAMRAAVAACSAAAAK